MRGYYLILILLVAFSVSAADLCTDTDGGGDDSKDAALKTKGSVKYGITSQYDTCLTSSDGVSTNSSNFLKEYYCRQDERDSEVYNCASIGLGSCKDGACVSGSSASNTTQTTTPSVPVSSCGNKKTEKDKGEQCDPPGSICFGKSTAEYGSCQNDCSCKIAASALKELQSKPAVCGDEFRHTSEECESDKDCPSNFVCSSCKCVKQLSKEEIEALKQKSVKKDEPVVKEEVKVDVPVEPIVAKNFSDDPALKATGGIASFFKGIFSWIAELFS